MVAEVIVNHRSRKVDKAFDYLIPDGMDVKIGSCVIVSFGAGDKRREGYVVAIKESSDALRLKSIIRISREIQLFDEKQLKLIKWLRDKYLVTYLDAIHLIAPSGTSVNQEEWLRIEKVETVKSKISLEIIRRILDNGGEIEINSLMSFFETDIKSQISDLIKKGILAKDFRDSKSVTDKVIRMARLSEGVDDVSNLIVELENHRAFVQAKMLELLSECNELSLADLVNFSQGNYTSLRTLENKGLVTVYDKIVYRDISYNENLSENKPEFIALTQEQDNAFNELKKSLKKGEFESFLLHGVTGSGKTEVYKHIIREAIESGRQAIMLVPEISLTPQLVSNFSRSFKSDIAVIHSGLSLNEKYDQWKKIREGRAKIVIGARSALFAPLDNIGVIIMDEEHEQTYKSEVTPRYSSHEVSEFIAREHNSLLIFASATPLVSTYYKAQSGKIRLLTLSKRYNNMDVPSVTLVDMREELAIGNKSIISTKLKEEIEKNLQNREQTILFLNRRGFSTFVSCRKCGYVAQCPNCSISMTYHKKDDTLKCHYCGHTVQNYTLCPECGSKYIRYFGGGTQKVEDEIKKLFPDASTIRMDIDTTSKKNGHADILHEFESKKIDILIGTQMVTKGLDFPDVTLVGVISADIILNIDDYRSKERTFSVIEQVTGRAGRGIKPGRSIIQTYSPDDKAIVLAKAHDYIGFFKNEIELRKVMWYPPFCEITAVNFSSRNEIQVSRCARAFAKILTAEKDNSQKMQVLGPVPAYISKVKNHYIYKITIKCENNDGLSEVLQYAKNTCLDNENYSGVSIVIDKNPNSMG